MMVPSKAVLLVSLLVLPFVLQGGEASLMLRSRKHHHNSKKVAPVATTVLLEKTEASKDASVNMDSLFNYESSEKKEQEKRQEKKEEKVEEMRFAQKSTALPAVGNPQGVYQFGSPYGRGAMDFNTPFRGMYNAFGGGHGPMDSVPHPYQGMGSFSPLINPRGFGLTGQNDNTTDLFAIKPMLPSVLTPVLPTMNSQLGGMGYASPFPAVMKGVGPDTMPFPPFSGKPFRAVGPHGPFTTNLNITLAANSPGKNTTLMGPLPFGPYGGGGPVTPQGAFGPYAYGGLPQMVNRGQIPVTTPGHPNAGRGPSGFVPGVPYGGPQAAFGMPSPYPSLNMGMPASGYGMPGFGVGGAYGNYGGFGTVPGQHFGPLPGVHPALNPSVVMHHQATMRQEKLGQFPLPGLLHNMGNGYPEPDMDRYHSVIMQPPVAPGGEAAKAAFFF